MKKTMSLLLALIMLLSGISVFPVSAESGVLDNLLGSAEDVAAAESALSYFEIKNLPSKIDSYAEFEGTAAWDKVSLLGINLDFLYSDKGALSWAELDVFKKDNNGNLVYGEDGYPVKLISKDDISLAFSNINTYLQNILYTMYGGLNMYTSDNAIGLANIIGNIFFHNFKELNPADYKNYFTNEIPSSNEFYRAVVTLSGFDGIVQANWVPRGKNYCEPVIKALCGNSLNFYDEYYTDGLVLSSKIVEAMVKKLLSVGPVDFIYDLVNSFSSQFFVSTYGEPLLALFTHKMPVIGSFIVEEDLYSFDGLLQLVFCDADCYTSGSGSVVKFCPFNFPTERLGATYDKDEALIYIYYYLNLCGRYKNNYEFFENVKDSIESNASISEDDTKKLKALVDGLFLGDFETALKDGIIPLYQVNSSSTSTSIIERMRNSFMIFLKKIADYFDYLRRIFSGELDYGQGNSPFN